jgi:anti-sigma factor ChrR (cupin superfamily)
MTKDRDTELSREELEALIEALAPGGAEPPASLRARVLARVARSTGASPREIKVVRAQEGPWQTYMPGVQAKVLHDDGVTCTWLARCLEDVRIPSHDHTFDEECLVLEGSIEMGGFEMSAGDYQLAPAGTHHEEGFARRGCVVLMRSGSQCVALAR